jgi:hypothetical protein
MTLIIGSILGTAGSVVYRMRGFDATLNRLVYWDADSVDSTGAQYSGPGPLSDIVVQAVKGKPTS